MEAGMSGKKKNGYNKSVYRSFALIMQFGINMLVPICILSALGVYLDQKLGTSYIMVILFFVGAVAGGQNVFRMAKKIYDAPGDGTRTADIQKRRGEGTDGKDTDVKDRNVKDKNVKNRDVKK